MIITIALIVAAVLAAIDVFNSRGRALTSWAALIIAIVLVAGRL